MCVYQDKKQDITRRVEDLLSRMTLKEKVGQLNQGIYGWEAYHITDDGFEVSQKFKDEVAVGDGVGALYCPFRADGWNVATFPGVRAKDSAKVINLLQRYLVEHTRLGIPMLISEECPHGHEALDGTSLPVNVAIGCTFHPALFERAAAMVARQIRSRGCTLGLVSALDVLQEPRWGRAEESYGEDPYLNSKLCAAVVKGFQGKDAKELAGNDKIVAVLKHLCAFGAPVGGHSGMCSYIGEREMREIHLPAMKAGAKAGALACMAAYNDVDGVPCHMNQTLLQDILRGEFEFDGLVMSDGCAVDMAQEQFGGYEGAGAAAVKAGVDLNLWNQAFMVLEQAVAKGMLSEAEIDVAVRHVLKVKFQLGLFENPYTDENLAEEAFANPEMNEINLKLAEESIVLLENRNHTLPLSQTIKTIAVIGPNADAVYNQLGDFTSWKKEGEVVTVLDGIRSAFPQSEILCEKGCDIRGASKDGFAQAIAAAKRADVVILAMGGSSARNPNTKYAENGEAVITGINTDVDTGEGRSIANLEIGEIQIALAKELRKLGKPLVGVIVCGRPFVLNWFSEHCDALLLAWYPGDMGGLAVGNILAGDICPSGKLSVSMPRHSGQLPVYYNNKGLRKYVDMPETPLYSFGDGKSYTEFAYSGLKVSSVSGQELEQGKKAKISVKVTNTGKMAGAETVLLFIRDVQSCVTRRVKELKGFEKVWLNPGEQKSAQFELGMDELGIWNLEMRFVIEPGTVEIMVGTEKTVLTITG